MLVTLARNDPRQLCDRELVDACLAKLKATAPIPILCNINIGYGLLLLPCTLRA
jgi:hypothetical protein